MDAEKKQKVEKLKAQMRGRLEHAEPEEFGTVKRQCLRYVKDWPEPEITAVRVMILEVQDERSEELPGHGQHRDDGRRMDVFMQLFEGCESLPDHVREKCQQQYTIGRQEVPNRR